MSLLNTMLKDLDTERGDVPSFTECLHSNDEPSAIAFRGVVLALLFLIVLSTYYVVMTRKSEPTITPPSSSLYPQLKSAVHDSEKRARDTLQKLTAYIASQSSSAFVYLNKAAKQAQLERQLAQRESAAQEKAEHIALEGIRSLPPSAAGNIRVLKKQTSVVPSNVDERKHAAIETAQHLTIEKTGETDDLKTSKTARNLIAKGRLQAAESILLNHIAAHPSAVASVQVLADFYFNSAAKEKLADLSVNTVFSDNSLRSYVLARHYTLRGENSIALSLLEEKSVHPFLVESYAALQAALFQKIGNYARAEAIYEELLRKRNDNTSWWLGYALSCDANKKTSTALHAYRRVLGMQPQAQQIVDYVETRVAALSALERERL